jgi:YEATS family
MHFRVSFTVIATSIPLFSIVLLILVPQLCIAVLKMSIKINFEVGHEASLKKQPTIEGYTHDWELFVRGIGDNDISHYVDKVVFILHESFPKPKRGEFDV